MELINNILSKLNNWCFNRWVKFGTIAGWIRSTQNNINSGVIFCNLPLKKTIRLKMSDNKIIKPLAKKPALRHTAESLKRTKAASDKFLNKQNKRRNNDKK